MRRQLEAVLAALIPRGELLVFCDYGAIRGEDAGLGRIRLLEHATRDPRDQVAVGITTRTVLLVPVQRCGLLRTRLQRVGRVELLPRTEVIVERGAVDELGRIPIRFVRRDGSACLVELVDDPAGWAALPR
jgi:hypothetical protein